MSMFSKTVTTVSAAASVNPLTPLEAKKSGMIQYAITTSALEVGYTEYRKMDAKQGATREIQKVYQTGVRTGSRVKFVALKGDDVTNPLDDYDDQTTVRNYKGEVEDTLDFMGMLLVKSDTYPDGVIKANDGSEAKIDALVMAKAMGLDLEEITESIVGTKPVPQQGTPEWNKYAKSYRATGGTPQGETAYRNKVVEDTEEKREADKDMTDVSVGYYGTFNPKSNTMPEAMYYTILSCLEHTQTYKPKAAGKPPVPGIGNPGDPGYIPPVPGTPDKDLGTARRFGIDGDLFSAVYSLNGYIHREINGIVPGNKREKLGFSKASVHLQSEKPLIINEGRALHNDFSSTNQPFFDKDNWNNAGSSINSVPDFYVSIKVQVTPTMYKELVIVDFVQETTIKGKGQVKRSNSGNQSKNEKEMTWTEAYIAESFIPLTRSSMMKIKMLHRSNLLIECKSHFIEMMNVTKTKLKWYQTKAFRAIMFVASLALAWFTAGQSLVLFLTNMAIGMAVGFALNTLIKVLVDMGIIDNAFVIALVAVVSIAAMVYASGLPIKMDFTLSTTLINTLEATGKVFAQLQVKEMDEHKAKVAELKKEEERIAAEAADLEGLHQSSSIGQLTADLQRMIDAVSGPLMETRDEFLDRTLSKRVVTEELTYNALNDRLYTILEGF